MSQTPAGDSLSRFTTGAAPETERVFFSELKGVGWDGLEPSTNALKGRCSTIELPTRFNKNPAKRDAVYRFAERRRQELSFLLS